MHVSGLSLSELLLSRVESIPAVMQETRVQFPDGETGTKYIQLQKVFTHSNTPVHRENHNMCRI